MGVRPGPAGDHLSDPQQLPHPSYPPQLLAPNGVCNGTPGPASEGSNSTKSRSLHGVRVQGEEVDDLFQMYGRRIL